MHYEDLKFSKTLIEGNTLATVRLDNGYLFDIIRKEKEKIFKVKGFEEVHGKKRYIPSYFDGYPDYPIFHTKGSLMTFINEVKLIEEE